MLYDRQIRNLKPAKHPYRRSDHPHTKGLYIQVTPNGTKIFEHRYKVDGKDRYFPLGEFPATSLEEARIDSGKARKLIKKGKDPKEEAQAELEREQAEKTELARKNAKREQQGTVDALFQFYCDDLEALDKPSHVQVRRLYHADIEKVIGDMRAKDVAPDDIRAVLRPIIKRKKMVMANRTRSYLVAAFNYGIEWKDATNYDHGTEFDITMNPAQTVRRPLKAEKPGERTLSEKELVTHWAEWADANKMTPPFGVVLRLILSTGGQRVEEVLKARWSEFNFRKGLWELPAGRRKNKRAHVVPLGEITKAELMTLRAGYRSGDLLFPGTAAGDSPMKTDSLGRAVRRYCKRTDCERFSARDLRRTVKTLMGYQGISKEIRDRLQGHAMTDVSSKHYDRYDYLAEKRAAMATWEAYLRRIVAGKESNVVHLEHQA